MGTTRILQLSRAAVFGLAAAAVGAVVWAELMVTTNYEVGFVAWGIGALVGAAVFRACPRRDGAVTAIAVALALLGVLAGKYLGFVLTARDQAPPGVDVPLVSRYTLDLLNANRDVVFGPFDLLWTGLAAFSAARFARGPEPLIVGSVLSVQQRDGDQARVPEQSQGE
jgi:hypothetical protein